MLDVVLKLQSDKNKIIKLEPLKLVLSHSHEL